MTLHIERERDRELLSALRNLQMLSIVNFLALLWILYLVGAK